MILLIKNIFVAIFKVIYILIFGYKEDKINKDASFLSKKDTKEFLNKKNRWLLLDWKDKRLSLKHSFEHLALIARSWWWKTSSYIIPNILALDDCSLVVTDPSSEIRRITQENLKNKWYKIIVLDPLNISHRYNPLSKADTTEKIKEISKILISSSNMSSSNQDWFWNAWAEKIITMTLKCLKNKERMEEKEVTLKDLQRQLNYFWSEEFDSVVTMYGDDDVFNEYKWFLLWNQKTNQSFLSTAQIALDSLSNPNIADFLSENSVDLQDLRDKKTAIFFTIPEQKLPHYSFLLNLFYTQLFNFCMEDLENTKMPILCLLDEFGHQSIPYFSSIVTTIRKYKVSISIILQSISQLEAKYGKQEADIILNGGISSRVFYSGADPSTTRLLADIIWTKKTKEDDTNYTRVENLVDHYNIRTLNDNQAIYIYGNKKPVLLEFTPYWKR
jgi:type IV secretion system protein VirD4